MTRRLYGDPELIDQIISRLTVTQSDEKSTQYIDDQTQESWKKSEVVSMYIGEPITTLIQLPEPTSLELIDITLSSEFDDEVIAASLRLRDNELNKGEEFREELLNVLKKINIQALDEGQKMRLKTIILLTELTHGENRREVIGRKTEEIKSDSDFFMRIAYQAEQILESLQ